MGFITSGRYASVASTLALVVALAGTSYAAVKVTGADIKNNTVSTKDVKDKTLKLKDLSPGATSSLKGATGPAGATGPTGPAGATGAAGKQGPQGDAGSKGDKGDKGDPCLSSDPNCRGPQGIPGTNGTNGTNGADGAPGAPGPSAQYVNVNLANTGYQEVTVGTFALSFNCSGGANNRVFTLGVKGSGGAQLAGVKGIDDNPNNALPFTIGVAMPTSFFASLASIGVNSPNPGATFGHYYRLGGTLVLHNNLRSMTLVYDMFLDDRPGNNGACSFRGSAVSSGLL